MVFVVTFEHLDEIKCMRKSLAILVISQYTSMYWNLNEADIQRQTGASKRYCGL